MLQRRAILLSLALGSALPALAGCGFRPLYGQPNANAAGISVDHQMAEIRIEPIANRLGQQLHNALRDRFNPLGQPASGGYALEVDLIQRIYGALARNDLSASRRNVEISAFYKLKDGWGNVLLSDMSQTTTGYDEFDDPLSDISAREDAQRRSTLQLADLIRTRVAVFLTAGTSPPAAPTAAVPATLAP